MIQLIEGLYFVYLTLVWSVPFERLSPRISSLGFTWGIENDRVHKRKFRSWQTSMPQATNIHFYDDKNLYAAKSYFDVWTIYLTDISYPITWNKHLQYTRMKYGE